MSKKPASLTSDLLARKGEAEPSTIDPAARMTLSAGPGYDDHNGGEYGSGRREPRLDDEPEYADAPPVPEMLSRRPMPPEPEIIYTAEETHGGGGSARLAIIAVLGLVIVGGIFLGMSGQETNSVAPVATVAPMATDGTTPEAANVTPAPETTAPVTMRQGSSEAVTTTPVPSGPTPSGNAPLNIAPNTAAPVAPLTEVPVSKAPVAEAAPVAETPAVATPVAPKAQSGGPYVVQLLALQDEAAAKAAWKKVSKKYSNILGGHALDIEQADLGAKGTWYRVRAAGFQSKSAAVSACAKLKAAGQDCMAKKR